MPRILVTYFSQTGNTKKVAEAIFKELPAEKELKSIDEAQNLERYHLIFIGFPVHSHGVPLKVEKFLKDIPYGKKIALFSTHGSFTGSRLSREAFEHAISVASRAVILGTFSCRGRVAPGMLEVLQKSVEHKAWAEMAASAEPHPDERDIEDARSFAKWIMTLYSANKS